MRVDEQLSLGNSTIRSDVENLVNLRGDRCAPMGFDQ